MKAGVNQKNKFARSHEQEIKAGERFEFGKNWKRFLELLDDERITIAEASLRDMLEVDDLSGATFLDVGSGSGLFSLAARGLDARVVSFDYDSESFACTQELKDRYFPDDSEWEINQGSVLDAGYMRSLGQFDVVYSWGVLHHTGDMWAALANAGDAVAVGGKLFIAIYNDTGSQSKRWEWIKRTYCKLPRTLKTPFAAIAIAPGEAKKLLSCVAKGNPGEYLSLWKDYSNDRGMNRWRDIIDWVGGYPYEYAGPSAVFDFFKARGFRLTQLRCDRVGLGCNEFVFEKIR